MNTEDSETDEIEATEVSEVLPPETTRKRGRPRDTPEVAAEKARIRAETRAKMAAAEKTAVAEYMKNRVDVAAPTPPPATTVVQAAPPPPPQKKKRPRAPPEFVNEVEKALASTFGVAGKTIVRVSTQGAQPEVSFPEKDSQLLAAAWAPIVARYLEIDGDFILWFMALSSTGFVVEKTALSVLAARKTIPSK